MTHSDIEYLLACVPRSRMSPEELESVRRELAVCPLCRHETRVDAFLEEALSPLREGRRQTALDLAASQRALARPSRRGAPAGRRRGWFLAQSAAAALLLTAGTLAAVGQLQRGQVAPRPHPPLSTGPEAAVAKGHPALEQAAPAPDPRSQTPPAQEPTALPAPPSDALGGAISPPPADPVRPSAAPLVTQGKARLKVIKEASAWSGHDSIRLSDCRQGLDFLEADLRVVTSSDMDGLAVSLGGGSDPARLTDLGTASQPPKSLVETDAAPIALGKTYLLKIQQGRVVRQYHIQVAGYSQGAFVDLEWSMVDGGKAQELAAQALLPRPAELIEAGPLKTKRPPQELLLQPGQPERNKRKP